MNLLLQKVIPHAIALAIFLAISMAFFYPQLEGKKVFQSDISQFKGMSKEIVDLREQEDRNILWTNAMFGGMPAYQISIVHSSNLMWKARHFLSLGFNLPIGIFLSAMVCFYIFMSVLGARTWLGIVGAITFALATNNLVLFEAGHNTKVLSIAYLPLVGAGILLALREKYLWGGLVFALGFALNLMANHVQMTYYFLLTFPFLGIAMLVHAIKKDELAKLWKAGAALLIGGLLAFGTSASNLLPTQEYSKDTMRGEPILKAEANQQVNASSQTNGLDWEYAMQWSNNTLDVLSGIVPRIVGGSSGESISTSSAAAGTLRKAGINPSGRLPMYWGALPFTSGPIYFGAVILLLFVFGLFAVDSPIKWWCLGGLILTCMLSMGKNLEWFNRFFFDYVPLFNKFRTPNSVLSITPFFLSALACLGLAKLFQSNTTDETRAKQLRWLYISTGLTGGLCLILWLFGPGMFTFEGTNPQANVEPIIDARASLLKADALRSLMLILATAGAIFVYLKGWLKWSFVFAAIALLALVDMWGVGRRYLSPDKFETARQVEAPFQERLADKDILQRENGRGQYRVLDFSTNPFQSAHTSYFHSSLGGYHAAKLQRAQDMIDRYWQGNMQRVGQALQNDPTPAGLSAALQNMQTLNMMNVKYLIINPEQPALPNSHAFGPAWVVQNQSMAADANAEIAMLNQGLNLRQQAVVPSSMSDYVAGLAPGATGNVTLTNYLPDDITYQANMNQEGLVVFSEVWYDKGWQAYIDGEPVDHIRANYLLRGLRVPAGQHEIRFAFEPTSLKVGNTISLISSLGILLGLLVLSGRSIKAWMDNPPAPEPPVKKTKATVRKKVKPKKRDK